MDACVLKTEENRERRRRRRKENEERTRLSGSKLLMTERCLNQVDSYLTITLDQNSVWILSTFCAFCFWQVDVTNHS